MGLLTLHLEGCYGLMGLPESLRGLTGLQKLNLEGCAASFAAFRIWETRATFLQ
jgi:hypothetical protein